MILKDYNMPYKAKGKCVYKKDTGKKVGCTTGSVKKYLAALHINAKESKTPTITQKSTLAQIRKPMPPPQKTFNAKKGPYNRKHFKPFKDFYNESYGLKVTDDTTATAEGVYAQAQDNVPQPGGYDTNGLMKVDMPLTNEAKKKQRDGVIDKVVNYLTKFIDKDFPAEGPDSQEFVKTLHKIAKALEDVGIEPVDIYATIEDPRMAQQYLIRGPSAPGGGGKGALKDLRDIKAGLLADDESNPGGMTDTAAIAQGIQGENFIDGKGPGRKGALEEHKKLSKLEQVIEEMNRREFIGKIAKGATAVAGGNIMPQGVAGNVLKGALGTKKLFNIDEILLNFIIPAEGRSIAAIATTRPAFLNELQFDKNIFGGLLDAINGKALNISISEKRSLEQYFSIIGMFENVITGKATKDEINTLDGFYDFEGRFGKKRPSLKDFVGLYEETMEDYYENNEDIIHSVLSDALTRYQLKPETYKELSDYGYEWYHYADTPEARKLRKQEEEKIAADNKKWQDEWNKAQEIEQARKKEEEEIRGSRFDYAGGEEDRAAPQEWDNRTGLPKKPYGGPGTYTVDENFIDKKGPGRPGDSKRHGIKKKSSLASLDKIVHSKSASPRKKQLAHWQANMRRGKAKKK